MLIIARSILFNVLFYLTMLFYIVVALPTVVMPYPVIVGVGKLWGRTSLWLLRMVCGTRVAFTGLDKIPAGPLIVASKHQSFLEAFALLTLFAAPTYIVKRELMWIPFFGWYMRKARVVPVDRGARAQALTAMTARVRAELKKGRQIIIFPEGTRRAPGDQPTYKYGVARLYTETDVPCLPVALNSGLFWGRRSFKRYPGTVRIQILDPIPPGLDREDFMARLQADIETATARLMAAGGPEP